MKTMLKTVDWWKVIKYLALIEAGAFTFLTVIVTLWTLAYGEFDKCLLSGIVLGAIGLLRLNRGI